MRNCSQQTVRPRLQIFDVMNRIPEPGPLPADALRPAVGKGAYQTVVVGHHQQGDAPFESVHGDDRGNVTVGLPVVGVSVDHDAPFDIADTGTAPEYGLVLACDRAAALAPGRGLVWCTGQNAAARLSD